MQPGPGKHHSRRTIALDHLRALRTREGRERQRQFYAEGVRFVASAMRHHAQIDALVVATPMLTGALGRGLAGRARGAGVPVLEVEARTFIELSTAAEPQGIGLVARQRWERMARVRPGHELCWVALESARSAGNLGSVIRTCEAVDAAGVILIGDAVDPYDPIAVRASMGAMFSRRFVRATPGQLAAWAARHGALLVGSSPRAVLDYRDAAYCRPLVVLMGGEQKGLPPDIKRMAETMVRIPMTGAIDSLNLAVATGVLLYEVFNRSPRI